MGSSGQPITCMHRKVRWAEVAFPSGEGGSPICGVSSDTGSPGGADGGRTPSGHQGRPSGLVRPLPKKAIPIIRVAQVSANAYIGHTSGIHMIHLTAPQENTHKQAHQQ